MRVDEFDSLMGIVYSRWGAKAYPDAVKMRIYKHCGVLPAKSFESIIFTLLDTCRTAPMPQEFKMLAYGERERLGIGQIKEPETKPSAVAKCWDCGDAGNLFVFRKDGQSRGVLRCHCPVGASRPTGQGAQWSSAFENTWAKEPIYQRDAGNWKPTPEQGVIEMLNFLRREPAKQKRTSELAPADFARLAQRDDGDDREGA